MPNDETNRKSWNVRFRVHLTTLAETQFAWRWMMNWKRRGRNQPWPECQNCLYICPENIKEVYSEATGERGGAGGWGTALQAGSSPFQFPMVSLEFRPHYGHGVVSASNKNEYWEYFLRGKCSWCVGLTTLPPSCADCLEIWEPQPPGTLRACPGQ